MRYIIKPDIFDNTGVRAFFTGKDPGADPDEISRILAVERRRIYMPVQEHTSRVLMLNELGAPEVADAVVTGMDGVVLGVQTADCVPILLYDRETDKIAAVHAGWRGTAAGLIKKTINSLGAVTNRGIVMAIGPAIRWCCYEVGQEVLDAVAAATGEGDYHMIRDGKLCLDLPSANKHQALSMGVDEGNIWMSDECTYCYPEKFHSYRFTGNTAGRQGSFIMKVGGSG